MLRGSSNSLKPPFPTAASDNFWDCLKVCSVIPVCKIQVYKDTELLDRLRKVVGCSQEESMMAGCSLHLSPVWLLETTINTFTFLALGRCNSKFVWSRLSSLQNDFTLADWSESGNEYQQFSQSHTWVDLKMVVSAQCLFGQKTICNLETLSPCLWYF